MKTVSLLLASCVILLGSDALFAASPTLLSSGNAIMHATHGCGGAVVLTPQPGTQFSMSGTDAPDSFYGKAARRGVTWASTMDCTSTGRTHALVPSSASPIVASTTPGMGTSGLNEGHVSSNWSGYQINNVARLVQAGWTVPAVINPHPSYSTSGYYSSTWSGIGGGFNSGNGPLIQSGSTQDIYGATASYYFWYEIVGGPSQTAGEQRIGIATKPGDAVGSTSIWLSGSNAATLGICNFTSGGCVQFQVTSTPQPGTTVEWIAEAPSDSYFHVLPLADFDSVAFHNACWASTYTPGFPIDCHPIATPGLSVPQPIALSQYIFNRYQTVANPQGLSNDGLSFFDMYNQPETGQ